MASIHREKRNGKTYYRLQFYDKDNRRRSIRLRTINRKAADKIKVKVEHLVSASVAGTLDRETSRWLTEIGDDLYKKLSGAGFAEFLPKRESATLAAFIDAYIESRTDLAENTVRNLKATRRWLVKFFDPGRNLRDIGPGDADDWKQFLVDNLPAEATRAKLIKRARQFFKSAQRKGLIETNPFADVKAGSEVNEERWCFVPRDTVDKAIEAAPDVQWRLIIALARYGGFRTPSETLLLKWGDIDWANGRITVTAPKTKKGGKPKRVIPLFPELRPYLTEAFDLAEPGTEFVITRYRQRNANLRTQLERIITNAGVDAWPRLFQNLRASRETELANQFPLHVVTAWLGNTPRVAEKHYLGMMDEHYEKAVRDGGATVGAKVVQQSVPQTSASSRTRSQKQSERAVNPAVFPTGAIACDAVPNNQVPPQGLEP